MPSPKKLYVPGQTTDPAVDEIPPPRNPRAPPGSRDNPVDLRPPRPPVDDPDDPWAPCPGCLGARTYPDPARWGEAVERDGARAVMSRILEHHRGQVGVPREWNGGRGAEGDLVPCPVCGGTGVARSSDVAAATLAKELWR